MVTPTNDAPASSASFPVSAPLWRSLFLWSVIAAGVALAAFTHIYWLRGWEVVLPLDDVYIHFQYARQIANGAPYVYNPGLPPSSGATSLLYPYLLAIGAALGFEGLALAYWALAIGFIALVGATWLVMRLGALAGLPSWAAIALGAAFALSGPVGWHAFSGMETGLLVAFMLLTFYMIWQRRFALSIAAAVLMAVTRPEGAIMAVIAAGGMLFAFWGRRWWLLALILPLAAPGLQPLVNRTITGQAEAAGSSAKSILSRVPPEPAAMFAQINANFWRMWGEWLTGFSPREGLYLPVGLLLAALVGLVVMAWGQRRVWPALIAFGWLVAGAAAVSTLDPAFWHFKRYQMPFMALMFPLAGWGLAWLWSHQRTLARAVLGLWLASALVSGGLFVNSYRLNVGYLLAQQVPMARWLAQNTPPDAAIAVHDVGLMRYLGGRTTVDMVGLTTPGASDSWRNGPGALAEFLFAYTPQPEYVASYTDALGLSYLADTAIYGESLAAYPVMVSDRFNVALAGSFQGVWRSDWSGMAQASEPHQPYITANIAGLGLVDSLNVANLSSEGAHAYTWSNGETLPGFPTEVYDHDYAVCGDVCTVMDGGRRINGEEAFTLGLAPGADALLVTRLHPAHAGTFDVYANGVLLGTRVIPNMPGRWLDVVTRIPGEHVTAQTRLRILPDTPGGHYMPYYHWAYQGDMPAAEPPEAVVTFGDGVGLAAVGLQQDEAALTVDVTWAVGGSGGGDARVFVHVYDDLDVPPLAQTDRYPLDGATPPGNWLAGELRDEFVVDLSDLSPGRYRVAMGLYAPASGARLIPITDDFDSTPDGRLLLDTITIAASD